MRDLLLGRVPKEFDYAFAGDIASFTIAHPEAKVVGKSVAGLIFNGFDFMPLRGKDLKEDLLKRDFTINALALEENGVLHTHPQALADLKAGILRPVAPGALANDPLRVYRAARFMAMLPDFTPHGDCLLQMREVAAAGLTANISAERVGRELLKALDTAAPSRFFRLLADTGCLEPWFSELAAAREITAGPLPFHDNSIFDHTCDIIDLLARNPDKSQLSVWMGLTHDLGKIHSPSENLPHHYGHELRGIKTAETLARRLSLANKYIRSGSLAAREHMKAGQYFKLRPGTRCDLLIAAHKAGFFLPFWQLADADSGLPVSEKALKDLQLILKVELPPEWRDRGAGTAEKLRGLRCEALARRGE